MTDPDVDGWEVQLMIYPGIALTFTVDRERREGLWLLPWACPWNDVLCWVRSAARSANRRSRSLNR